MSKDSDRESARIQQLQIESECERMIEVVMNAIAADLGSCGDRTRALAAINDLSDKSNQEPGLLVIKSAAKLALEELSLYFVELGISLPKVVEALENKSMLEVEVVQQIQDAAKSWSDLGRIGS